MELVMDSRDIAPPVLASGSRSAGLRDYGHYFVFPNLSLAVTAGAFLSVQSYDPVAPGSLVLKHQLFPARSRRAGGAARQTVALLPISFNRQVLDEDRCESEAV